MTPYHYKEANKKLGEYRDLWLNTKDWKNNNIKWRTCKWLELDGSEVETNVANYKLTLNKLRKKFKNDEEAKTIVENIDIMLNDIKDFEQYIPLVVNLRTDGM